MQELSNIEMSQVVGGGRDDSGGESSMDRHLNEARKAVRNIWRRNWVSVALHSSKLNEGEQKGLDRIRGNGGAYHGHAGRQDGSVSGFGR